MCDRCYELFREPDIHSMCRWVNIIIITIIIIIIIMSRSRCFTSSYFSLCVTSLMLGEQAPHFSNLQQPLG